MSESMIGRVFNNRYKITERIGIGGMAEVYRAQDTVLGRMVAVKVMLPQYAADQTFTQRFRQEAAAAANLQSPYIVNVYDWGQDAGTYYIVMEYVRGSDLKSAIKERGAINQRKVAEIGAQVCQALSVAHNLDIIHRDIKPQNIMIQPDGNVKVMDFGIARAKNSVKTQTSSVLGTAHYVSPEQAQGKDLTYASDIYSLGIVLYEAATGSLPFDGPDAVSVAMKQVQELPALPSEINPNIDPTLEAIIMRALDKNPDNRFATALDMKQALKDYLNGKPALTNDFTAANTTVMAGVAPIAAAEGGTQVMPAVGGMSHAATPGSIKRGGSSEEDKDAQRGRIAIILSLVAAVIVIASVIFGLTQCSGSQIEVPNVVGMERSEAEQAIRNAGFEVGTISSVKSDTVEKNHIVSQDPEKGTRRAKNSKINLTVSSGKDTIEVPDVVGQTEEDARRTLEDRGFQVSTRTENSETVEENHVISTNPTAKSQVSPGSIITLIVSSGVEVVDVPNIEGMSRSEASSVLARAGFEVAFTEQESSASKEGVVISYSPNGKANRGSTITVVIGSGPSLSQVPSVIGSDVTSATTKLENAGFVVSVRYDSSSSRPYGEVISQSPPSGSSVAPGSTVTITVSSGSQGSSSSSSNSSPNSSQTTPGTETQ